MNINDKAPDFRTTDENGKEVALKDFRGKTVVLYFYPKADTPGCTKEACGFRDTYKKIEKTGAVLAGISADTATSQKKFQDKFSLPFTLLADADKKIAEKFGVVKEKNMYGRKVMGIARTTFVIGPDGKIEHIFNNVKPEGHAEEVLDYLRSQKREVRSLGIENARSVSTPLSRILQSRSAPGGAGAAGEGARTQNFAGHSRRTHRRD